MGDHERAARLAEFTPGNDRTWGAGNWIECDRCPRDALSNRIFHHRDAHDGPLDR